MKLIIAGSRNLDIGNLFLCDLLDFIGKPLTEVISGGCPTGPDLFAKNVFEDFAGIKYTEFPADWDKHGKAAGPIRNREMAEYSDALLLIWDGESRGSKNMKEEMLKLNKPVYEVILRTYNEKI